MSATFSLIALTLSGVVHHAGYHSLAECRAAEAAQSSAYFVACVPEPSERVCSADPERMPPIVYAPVSPH